MSIKQWLDSQAASRAVIIGMLGYFIWAGWLTLQNAHIVSCQAKYAEAQARSTQGRSQANTDNWAAVDDMVAGVTNAKSPADSRAALLKYLAARKAADEKRAANPLPDPPSQFCN